LNGKFSSFLAIAVSYATADSLECSYSDCHFVKSPEAIDEQVPLDFALYAPDFLNSVESLTFDYASVYQLSSRLLASLPNLQTIVAKRSGIKRINRGLFGAQNGGKLRHLVLSENVMYRIENFTFLGTRQLETLDLSSNAIDKIEPAAFKGLSELCVLNLSHNLLTQLDGALFLETEVLYNIDLSANHLVAFNFDMFANVKRFQFVALNDNNLTELTGEEINRSVHTLDLSRNPVMNGTVLAHLENLVSLRAASNQDDTAYDYKPILNLSFYNTLLQK
jgi:Leucine-rich repeat (LRR) protein